MPSVIVSSLAAAADAHARCKPGYVISILDSDDAVPEPFRQLPKERHLRLDPSACEKDIAASILEFAKNWTTSDENILIHCHRGVARSMAIAYVLLCARNAGECEEKIAARLRAAAPHADPNLRLVSEADRLLERDDRMVGAILDLCPCCSTVCAPVVTLPAAP